MAKTMDKALDKNEIAALMGCKPASALARLVALGYTEVCSRCGGSGQYSWNQIDGSRCFGCGGVGKTLARITATTVAAALERIAAGELVGYFAENSARREIKAADKALWETYMGGQIGKDYMTISKAMNDASAFLESPVYRAQILRNRIMDRAHSFVNPHKTAPEAKLSHVERLAKIREAQAMILEIEAAWAACS